MKIVYNAKTKEITKEEFTRKQLTQEQLKNYRINEIKEELNELDKTINRATEDLYVLSNLTPYAGITEIINKKNKLREELKEVL